MTTKRSYTDIVLEAVQDLHAKEQIVTRETVSGLTGLKLSVIDERLSKLIDMGDIHRVQRGVFVPATRHPPARVVNRIILPDGTTKLEVGDDHVLTLTPREDRTLAVLMMGVAQEFASIELGHQAAVLNSDLSRQVRDLRREVEDLRKELESRPPPQ